jgi:iron complex outermembrane recepter protein
MEGEMKAIFFVVAAAIVLSASFVYADTDENTDVDLEKIVVTPVRMEQGDYEAISNVTVIGARDIKYSNAKSVADALSQEAGLNITKNSTDKTTRVDIRGFGDTDISNVLVLIDGRRINSIDQSGPDWLQIPLEAIERIEVVRGAGSILYGDNATGGVVNIITKKGTGKLSGRVGTMVGSYRTRQDDAEIQGSNGKTSYYLYSKYYDTEGYRANSAFLSKDANARADFKATELLSLGVSGGWHKDDYGMPGGLDDQGELATLGRRGSTDTSDFGSTKDRFIKLSVDATPMLKGMDIGTFAIDYSYRNRDAYSWQYFGGSPTAMKAKIDTRGITLKNTQNRTIWSKDLKLVTGIDYYNVKDTMNNTTGGFWPSTDDLTIYKEELGFYGYSEYEAMNNLFLNAEARYEKAKYRFDQQQSSVLYETRVPSVTLFGGGLKYEYGKGSNVFANVQETFRFVATDEWFSTWTGLNTNLKQQTGIQYEMGVKHNVNDMFLITATPYIIDLNNEIYTNPVPAPGKSENYDHTRRKGVELGLQSDLKKFYDISYLDKLEVFTNCTFEDARFRGGVYNGKYIPMVPKTQNNTGFRAGFLKNYTLSVTAKYVGDMYAINDTKNETTKVKNYITADGRLSYINNFMEIYGGINNIFNEKYSTFVAKSTSSSKKDYYPAPERNFELGAIYKW